MADGNGQVEMWSICLDETKRYFILRRPEDNITDGGAVLSIPKDRAEKIFTEVCDQYKCGVKALEHVYCYGCDALSHGICKDHPLVFVIDRPVKMEADAVNTFPSFLCLKPSTIPNAGMGVFTDIFLPAGSAMGPYGGVMFVGDDSKATHDYSWEIEVPRSAKPMTVDAGDPKRSNYMRWINCARYKEEQNMICLQYHKRIYYIVYKPVYPGQELMVWYGDAYAHRLGIENVRRASDLYAPPKAKRDPKKTMMAHWTYETEDIA